MTQTLEHSQTRPSLRPVLWTAPLAGVLASLVNILIWLALRGAFETIRVGPPGEEVPFWSGAVVLFSMVAALGAGAVHALISRLTRNPNRVFWWISVVVLLVSFLTPIGIKNPSVSVVFGLELMHVVAFAFVLWLVPRR